MAHISELAAAQDIREDPTDKQAKSRQPNGVKPISPRRAYRSRVEDGDENETKYQETVQGQSERPDNLAQSASRRVVDE